jgi:tetratricopeptide (TPR) repeat protein
MEILMRTLPFLFCLIAGVLHSPAQTLACLNDYQSNSAAEKSKGIMEALTSAPIIEPWETRRDRLRKAVEAGGDYKVKNDLAGALMHTGDPKAAVQLLEEIEGMHPGEYRTASNLGTAYELAGDPEKALVWIRKGIERNSESHEGTEWLHVKILEAKIALASDPNWLESHRVLGTDFAGKTEIGPVAGNRGEPLDLPKIQAALKYQLHERLQFVKPPDAIVGNLLVDLGTLIFQDDGSYAGTSGVFKLAAEYLGGTPAGSSLASAAEFGLQSAVNAERLEKRNPTFWEKLENSGLVIYWFSLGLGGVIALWVISLLRRSRASRHSGDQ